MNDNEWELVIWCKGFTRHIRGSRGLLEYRIKDWHAAVTLPLSSLEGHVFTCEYGTGNEKDIFSARLSEIKGMCIQRVIDGPCGESND